jgi:hypothetical protein
MTCALCHRQFENGDPLRVDVNTMQWVHGECPNVYDVDEVRSKIMAQYASYIEGQKNVTEAREFAAGHTTESDVIIAHALGVQL